MTLLVERLSTGFGPVKVLREIDLQVRVGEATVLFGLNGAGKSVTLKTISGIQPTWAGRIVLDGNDITRLDVEGRVRAGLSHVLQVKGVFPHLTIEENLRLGGACLPDKTAMQQRRSELYDLYPRLADRRLQRAGTLSGGERAMLAVARGLMGRPRLLLVDEPSAGLSPAMVEHLFDTLDTARRQGVALLIAEQNVAFGLRAADEVIVLDRGTVTHRATAASLDPSQIASLLGVGPLVVAPEHTPRPRGRGHADDG
jgi:branched-chain amino acid transport system ATP-binding protein